MHGRGGTHGRGHVWWGACMAGGMCGRGAMCSRRVCVVGACMIGGMHGRRHVWKGHAWQGGHVWQERQPLQQMVRILLECILVVKTFIFIFFSQQ